MNCFSQEKLSSDFLKDIFQIVSLIATTAVGSQFAKFKEAGTSFQHFLSTFINFEQISWRHICSCFRRLSKIKICMRHVKLAWSGCPTPTFKTSVCCIWIYCIPIRELQCNNLSFRNALHFERQFTRFCLVEDNSPHPSFILMAWVKVYTLSGKTEVNSSRKKCF